MIMERRRLSRNRSWVDLHRVCDISTFVAIHFRDYQNYFCRPLTSLPSTFGGFQIQVTSPPRRSSLVSPARFSRLMRTVRLAAVVPGTDLQLGLTSGSHSRDGTPLHPR